MNPWLSSINILLFYSNTKIICLIREILKINTIYNGYILKNKIKQFIQKNEKYKNFEIKKGDFLIVIGETKKITELAGKVDH